MADWLEAANYDPLLFLWGQLRGATDEHGIVNFFLTHCRTRTIRCSTVAYMGLYCRALRPEVTHGLTSTAHDGTLNDGAQSYLFC
jgi:hypothetical protein